MRPSRVEVRHLSKRFGPVRAVDDLSFSVEPGSITGFLGPNGAGKTTTLRMILGLVRPTAGTATIDGHRYAELPHPTRTVGAVLDTSGLHPGVSARNHLRVYCDMAGLPGRRADEVVETLDMSSFADRPARGFSTGMRQRLSLATALLADPSVLLLDEPGNGLDPHGIAWLRALLRTLADEGRTILVSSHVLSEVELLADRAVVIRSGRLVTEGTLADLASLYASSVVIQSPDLDRLRPLLQDLSGSARVEVTGSDRLTVRGPTPEQVGDAVAAAGGIRIYELTVQSTSLEQAFLHLTGRESEPVVA